MIGGFIGVGVGDVYVPDAGGDVTPPPSNIGPHPAIAPYSARSASQIIAYIKARDRLSVANIAAIRATDFSGQTAGLFVEANLSRYDLDTTSTSADDGVDNIIDAAGNHFTRISEEPTLTRVYTNSDIVGGAITIDSGVDRALFNVTVAADVIMPASESRGGRSLLLKDIGGSAASATLTPVFQPGESCDGLDGSAFAITANYGWVEFGPLDFGYYVI